MSAPSLYDEASVRTGIDPAAAHAIASRAENADGVPAVAHDDCAVEQRPFFLAEQETGAAGDRGAGDRAEQMADDAAADARIEDDRHLADGRLAGVQPRDGAGSGARARLFRA